jgi:hypothetical protein
MFGLRHNRDFFGHSLTPSMVDLIGSGVPADLDPPQNGPPGPNPLASVFIR